MCSYYWIWEFKKACELATSPGRTEILKAELSGTDDGYWRIKTNQEISCILKGQNIIGFIKKNIKLVRPC